MANIGSSNSRTTARKKKRMLKALESTLGVVSPACDIAKVGRRTHYDWLQNDPAYKAAVEEVAERCLDFAETSLLTQVKNKNTVATIFYLKTKGKKRGYIEGPVLNLNKDISDLSKLSDEELEILEKSGYAGYKAISERGEDS